LNPIAWHGIVLEVCNKHGITVFDLAMMPKARSALIRGEVIERMRAELNMSYPEIKVVFHHMGHSALYDSHAAYVRSLEDVA
jgi:hypothetical protein